MKRCAKHCDCAKVTSDLKPPDEIIKRIRKLRWIGMEEEAHALELSARSITKIGPVLTGQLDTD